MLTGSNVVVLLEIETPEKGRPASVVAHLSTQLVLPQCLQPRWEDTSGVARWCESSTVKEILHYLGRLAWKDTFWNPLWFIKPVKYPAVIIRIQLYLTWTVKIHPLCLPLFWPWTTRWILKGATWSWSLCLHASYSCNVQNKILSCRIHVCFFIEYTKRSIFVQLSSFLPPAYINTAIA